MHWEKFLYRAGIKYRQKKLQIPRNATCRERNTWKENVGPEIHICGFVKQKLDSKSEPLGKSSRTELGRPGANYRKN